jgi:hypothetical protein
MPSATDIDRAEAQARGKHSGRPTNFERGLQLPPKDPLEEGVKARKEAIDFTPSYSGKPTNLERGLETRARSSAPRRVPPRVKAKVKPDPLRVAEARAYITKRSRDPGARFLSPRHTYPGEQTEWASRLAPIQGRINVAMVHNYNDLNGDEIADALNERSNDTAPVVLGSCRAVVRGSPARVIRADQVQRVANLTGKAVLAPDHLVPPSEVAEVVSWLNENDADALGGLHPRVGIFTRDDAPPREGWRWTYPTFSR